MIERYTVRYTEDGETRNLSLLGWNEDDIRRTFLRRYVPGSAPEIVSIEKTED